jgi:hypothetical protein
MIVQSRSSIRSSLCFYIYRFIYRFKKEKEQEGNGIEQKNETDSPFHTTSQFSNLETTSLPNSSSPSHCGPFSSLSSSPA